MSEGSHVIGGRTYRRVPTTNEQKPVGPVEPQKLTVITTAIIPEKTKPDPKPKGTDPSRMITTHDEPPVKAFDAKGIIDNIELRTDGWKENVEAKRDVEDMSQDSPDKTRKKSGQPKKTKL